MSTINRPVKFTGTRQEADENHKTHEFVPAGPNGEEGLECHNCGSRPASIGAEYPCGEIPPREDVEVNW